MMVVIGVGRTEVVATVHAGSVMVPSRRGGDRRRRHRYTVSGNFIPS